MRFSKHRVGASLGIAILIAIGAAEWWVHRLQKRVDDIERVWEGKASDTELVNFLASNDKILLSNTLTELEHRRVVGGRDSAAKLLTDPDIHVWYCAGLYLGCLGDKRSIPCLIRGLDHPAWRSRPRVVEYLKSMTGQDFGEEKQAWVAWWSAQNNNEKFDFSWDKTQQLGPTNGSPIRLRP
ncbi:MAG: hypothetical protein JWM68_2417 [Verrucomicrobiales bacterium]|nr:hypothetical protein [Verrucomicrobiales bacterium]